MRSTLTNSREIELAATEQLLTGWGLTSPSRANVYDPTRVEEVAAVLANSGSRGVIARGLGRSYGDAAQNAGGEVLTMTGLKGVGKIDRSTGEVTVAGGVSLSELIRELLPLGRFPIVTPGTRYVTIGGAIAADIHGKNHHHDGSFCDHVRSLKLLTPSGEIRELSAEKDPDVFAATAGGMGLTGVILEATIATMPVASNRVWVDTQRAGNLEEALAAMVSDDDSYRYSAAWIDCRARGSALGRSVLTRGDHAQLEDLPVSERESALRTAPEPRVRIPVSAPARLLSRTAIRLFNELWFQRTPRQRRRDLQSVFSFLYPLDGIADWNRLYGKPGFLQYQFVLPFGQEGTLTEIVEALSKARLVSLGVLKRFGRQQRGLLSFPMPGWTLAVDIPTRFDGAAALLDRFDELVAQAGGRVYLAKDSRLRPELLKQFYPQLERWKTIQSELDPLGRMQSDLARRIGLRD